MTSAQYLPICISDPHPGNMMRTTDGKLAILDFGLMTEVTDAQRYDAKSSSCARRAEFFSTDLTIGSLFHSDL